MKTCISETMKEQKINFCKLYNSQKLKDTKNYNAYIFNIDFKYFVVDCDDKASFKYMRKLLVKHNFTDAAIYTQSISNIYNNQKYKHHIYFKNNLNLKTNKMGINGGSLDLLCNKLLFEDSEQFNNLKFDEIPEITQEFYNDLLLFNKTVKETAPQDLLNPFKKWMKM